MLDKGFPGVLYVVATPIGNLGDITFRAAEILGQVDVILAEDTRRTRKLLQHYDLHTPLISYHQHSHGPKEAAILERLSEGQRVALVTDAGTPSLADPGSRLVARVRKDGYDVVPLPGPSALICALSASGFGGDEFTFVGFLPHKKGRQTRLASLQKFPMPVILYESPHRLVKLLDELSKRYPHSYVMVARELTKVHEEFRSDSPPRLAEYYRAHPPKGEVVVILRA